MLSNEIIRKIKHIQLKAGYLATDALAGEYISAFKGVGMEFDRVREYEPGDDVRNIDWNVTARMNSPYVKVFREERELTLMLLIDVSASQLFGSKKQFKHELAAELAAILAFLAIRNNDKVGLIIFSDHIEGFIPPQKGRSHIWHIIRSVLTHQTQGTKTNISVALEYLNQVQKKKSLTFLLSDFHDEGYEKNIKVASRRHQLTCIKIADEREYHLPNCGMIGFKDLESGEDIIVDSSDPQFVQALKQMSDEESSKLNQFFRRHRIDFFTVDTKGSAIEPLAQYLKRKERKK